METLIVLLMNMLETKLGETQFLYHHINGTGTLAATHNRQHTALNEINDQAGLLDQKPAEEQLAALEDLALKNAFVSVQAAATANDYGMSGRKLAEHLDASKKNFEAAVPEPLKPQIEPVSLKLAKKLTEVYRRSQH